MKLAFWSVTRNAGKKILEYKNKLNDNFSIDLYTLQKFQIENTITIDNFTETLNEKFKDYDAHIFIMATGIVVRKISNLIKSKDIDPAVIVIDEAGNFCISLLSGHLGGANELTNILAKYLNLIPVITTSSDISGKIAVDTISQKLKSKIDNLEKAKNVTALIVDGKNVDLLLPKNVFVKEINSSSSGLIINSNKKNIEISRIYPKNIILGIGCRKNILEENIKNAVNEVLTKNNIAIESVKKIASIDIKKDEKGLLDFAKNLNVDLEFIESEKIKKVEEQFKKSTFVLKNVGVSSVSAPAAFLASNKNGKFIEEKFILNGVTVSIYEEEIYE